MVKKINDHIRYLSGNGTMSKDWAVLLFSRWRTSLLGLIPFRMIVMILNLYWLYNANSKQTIPDQPRFDEFVRFPLESFSETTLWGLAEFAGHEGPHWLGRICVIDSLVFFSGGNNVALT